MYYFVMFVISSQEPKITNEGNYLNFTIYYKNKLVNINYFIAHYKKEIINFPVKSNRTTFFSHLRSYCR